MLEEQDIVLSSPQSPRWSYALTKALDEQLALSYHHQHRLPAVIVRLFNVIGPGQIGEYGMVVPRFASWSQTGWPLRIYGDGMQRRTFCDVRDVVDAMVRLLVDSVHHGQLFNLGRDEKVTIRKLADLVIELSQADVTTCPMNMRTIGRMKTRFDGYRIWSAFARQSVLSHTTVSGIL